MFVDSRCGQSTTFRFVSDMRTLNNIAGSALAIRALYLALVAIFAVTRLPLYAGYWIPAFAPDSGSYFDGAYQVATGHWPLFGVRTPGYPLFLFVTLAVTRHISAVIVLQQLSILISGLCLYSALVRARGWLAVPAALAVAGLFCAGDLVIYETYMETEALYTACLVG